MHHSTNFDCFNNSDLRHMRLPRYSPRQSPKPSPKQYNNSKLGATQEKFGSKRMMMDYSRRSSPHNKFINEQMSSRNQLVFQNDRRASLRNLNQDSTSNSPRNVTLIQQSTLSKDFLTLCDDMKSQRGGPKIPSKNRESFDFDRMSFPKIDLMLPSVQVEERFKTFQATSLDGSSVSPQQQAIKLDLQSLSPSHYMNQSKDSLSGDGGKIYFDQGVLQIKLQNLDNIKDSLHSPGINQFNSVSSYGPLHIEEDYEVKQIVEGPPSDNFVFSFADAKPLNLNQKDRLNLNTGGGTTTSSQEINRHMKTIAATPDTYVAPAKKYTRAQLSGTQTSTAVNEFKQKIRESLNQTTLNESLESLQALKQIKKERLKLNKVLVKRRKELDR